MASSPLRAHALSAVSRDLSSSAPFSSRLLELWHLLSLDAPAVAMLWTWSIAWSNRTEVPLSSILAMGVAVWILYAADRLLDSRVLDSRVRNIAPHRTQPSCEQQPLPCSVVDLEERHRFHYRYRRFFLASLLLAFVVLGGLLPTLTPTPLRLYAFLGVLLLGWFAIIHAAHDSARRRVPKELGVGIFFSAATFIPTIARHPDLRVPLLPVALLFAALCSLNCLFIYSWEHPCPSEAHPSTQLALRHLPALAIGIAAATGVLLFLDHHAPTTLLLSCGASALLLLLLDWQRRRVTRTTLRASADLALLSPLLFLAAAFR